MVITDQIMSNQGAQNTKESGIEAVFWDYDGRVTQLEKENGREAVSHEASCSKKC